MIPTMIMIILFTRSWPRLSKKHFACVTNIGEKFSYCFYFFMFRKLKLIHMPAYEVPQEIFEIERNSGPVKSLSCLPNCAQSVAECRMDERKYMDTYKAMVYFEEAAQMEFLSQFNQTNIKFAYWGSGRLFFMKNEVDTASVCSSTFISNIQCFICDYRSHQVKWAKQ